MKTPPYGKQPKDGDVYIFATPDSWARAQAISANYGLPLPPGESFFDYEWPVRGRHVFLYAKPDDIALLYVDFLLSLGASWVVLPLGDSLDNLDFRTKL